MSYLGRKPIKIPSQVNLVLEGNVLLVEGPLGSLKRKIDNEINVQIDDDTLVVKKPLKKKHFSLWGLYRKLIVNMVTGVSIGFSTQLKMVGVGYRAEVIQSDNGTLSLLLKLGFSHPIQMDVPAGIEVSIVKTSNNDIIPIICIFTITFIFTIDPTMPLSSLATGTRTRPPRSPHARRPRCERRCAAA